MHTTPLSPNARRGRTFTCRESLWEGLEELATNLQCSVDFLVNEAVRQYLRQRSVRVGVQSLPPPPPPPPRKLPPPLPPPRLSMVYRGQRHTIDKSGFVIGRGRKG